MKRSENNSLFATFVVPFFALLFLGAFPGFSGPAQAANYASLSGKAAGPGDLSVSWEVKQNVPGKKKENEDNDWAWLVVSPSVKGKKIPAIYFEGEYGFFLTGPKLNLVAIEDYNFDGHGDLQLLEGWSNRGAYGPVFLFNPATGVFEKSEAFTELSLQSVDKERKRVISLPRASVCEGGKQEFIVKDFDKLELVYEEMTSCDDEPLPDDQYRVHKRSYKDGKLVSEEVEIQKN